MEPNLKLKLIKVIERHKIAYMRIFGSAIKNFATARDVDLVVPKLDISLENRLKLIRDLEDIFNKKVDLVELTDRLSPQTTLEIAGKSQVLAEAPMGRDQYATTLDRLHALATDALLSYSEDLKKLKLKETQKKLKDA